MGYRPVPQTSDRLFSTYTTDERRAMYDYVVSQIGGAEPLNLEDLQLPFEVDKKNDQQKSTLELLAEERDAKRRRISYRSKKVSTNRKSYTEVMREVIENQMQMYRLLLKKDFKEEDESDSVCEPTKHQCNDEDGDDYEESESRHGLEQNSKTSKTNYDSDEKLHLKHSSEMHKNIHGSVSRDKYEGKRHKDIDFKYDRYDRSRPKHSGQGHSREYYDKYRSRSRDRHSSRGQEDDGYRDKEPRDKRDRHTSRRREDKGYRDKESRDGYHRRDDPGRDRGRSYRDRDRRESNPVTEERPSKHRYQPESTDHSVTDNPIKIKEEKVSDDELQNNSKSDDHRIFEDMQRLLDAHTKADEERAQYKDFIKPVPNAVEDKTTGASEPVTNPHFNEELSDGSHAHVKQKSRSHKRKDRKKSDHKHKKHRYRKRTSSVDSSESNQSDFSC